MLVTVTLLIWVMYAVRVSITVGVVFSWRLENRPCILWLGETSVTASGCWYSFLTASAGGVRSDGACVGPGMPARPRLRGSTVTTMVRTSVAVSRSFRVIVTTTVLVDVDSMVVPGEDRASVVVTSLFVVAVTVIVEVAL